VSFKPYLADFERTSLAGDRKRKVRLPDGSEVEGTVLSVRGSDEHWNEYLVDDGTVIRVKMVATEVIRFDGQFDAQGNPVYMLQSTNVMAVSAPDNLRRRD
jgi:hypothetical protein